MSSDWCSDSDFRRWSEPDLISGHGPTDRYGPLFLALIGTLILSPFFGDGPGQRAALVIVVGLVVLASFSATGVRSLRALRFMVGAGVAVAIPVALAGGAVVESIVLIVLGIGMALGPPNIVRRIFEHERVTLQLVVAALCAYVQIGFAFAFGFAALDRFSDGSVLTGVAAERFFDYVYFSFITLTTVGYGDITAISDIARSMTIVETLLGQIFLVVLVAYLVGTLSGTRKQPPLDQ